MRTLEEHAGLPGLFVPGESRKKPRLRELRKRAVARSVSAWRGRAATRAGRRSPARDAGGSRMEPLSILSMDGD
jgi:hypothetical protein